MEILEGCVADLSHDGRGVVRVDGKVYFVEGALPGESIRFTRQKRWRKHEIGRLEEIRETADHRVDPPCQYFGVCGGCAVQHLSLAGQVEYKQRMLLDNLEKIGRVEPDTLLAPLTGPASGYRRKARLGIRHVPRKGGVLVGFRERHKSYITSLDHCLALHPDVSALLPRLHSLVAELSCFDRLPQIEVACGDEHMAMVFRHLEPLNARDLELLECFALDGRVDVHLQGGGPHTVQPLNPEFARPLSYHLPTQDIRIEFLPTDFVQINGHVNRLMVDRVVEMMEPESGDSILELFCGIGNFSLPLARHAGRLLGVESNAEMVGRAGSNAGLNNLENLEFTVADLYTSEVERLSAHNECNKLFLDPPRTGAMEVVRDLVPRLRPEKIVYVSCNPSTLARDSEVLVRKEGYRLVAAGVIDMFPHTAHVESIAVFQR